MKLLKAILCVLLVPFGIIPNCDGAVVVGAERRTSGNQYKVTAYCPCKKCCGKNAKGLTKSEYKIQYSDKLCAADYSVPFGTMIEIPCYGTVPVLDRGGKIKGKKLDVLFYEKSQDPNKTDLEWSHELALQWGVQYLEVRTEK